MTFLSATRAVVMASTIVAAFTEAYLGRAYGPPQVLWIGAGGFVLLLAAGQRLRRIALPILMASAYVAPAVLLTGLGARGYWLDVIWILPLVGLILSDRGARGWSLPGRWQWPLITWATLVAVSWPIVFLREADFALWILPLERVSNTSIGIGPWDVDLNVGYFAVGHLVGILWVDALCRWYRDDRARFTREVASGLLAAAGVAAAVSIYQGFFDLGFLNRGFWEYMIRASGTLADANKLGAVAAFWTVGALVFARGMQWPWQAAIAAAGLVFGTAAAWLSGSRTGLVAVLISLVVAAVETLRWSRLDRRKLAGGAAGAVAIAIAMVVVLQNAATHTIVQRGTLGYLPIFGDRGIAESANELLWDRFGYGPAAIAMIKEHPIEGVGAGMYHTLGYDYSRLAGRLIRAPDNAQAWWRHHLAELGLVGFVPLLWWCVVFGRQLFARAPSSDRVSTGMLRGVLVAFFIAALFGVPAQSAAIAMTFWVFAFWFALESGQLRPTAAAPWRPPLIWAAVAIVVIHVGATAVEAVGDLRPRNRAQRFDWYYRYGYVQPDDVEPDPGGSPVGRRWTMKDSLAVIKVRGKALKFAASVDHPDAIDKPVHARIWADSNLVFEGDVRRGAPLLLTIPATPGRTHLVLETEIDRLWRPSDSGSRDRRELGLSIRDWQWE